MVAIVEAGVPGGKSDWGAHATRVLVLATRQNELRCANLDIQAQTRGIVEAAVLRRN